MKTIAIDFDGVIHKYSKGWFDGSCYDEPFEGAFVTIGKLMLAGYSVFIHTTRDSDQVIKWFEKWKSPFEVWKIPDHEKFWNNNTTIGVTNRKLPAIAYIDDRAIKFDGNWKDILKIDFNKL